MAKSLQTRSKTIRKAIQEYNTAAATMSPPRPALDWSDVSHYGLLEQYALLKAHNTDLSTKQWAQPVYREILKCRRRIVRAQEEITRCNVEVRRLHTGIHDDAIHFKTVVRKLKDEQSPMYEAVKAFAKRRNATHRALLKRIRKLYALPDFTGDPTPGTRFGCDGKADPLPDDEDETEGNDLLRGDDPEEQQGQEEEEEEEEEAAESDDEFRHEIKDVVTFVCNNHD